jgi:hypothetical protein
MSFPPLPVLLLFGFLLVPCSSFGGTLIFGLTNMPDTSTTACGSGCPELTSGTGDGLFTLVGNATIAGFTFWTFESPGSYKGGSFLWSIRTDVGNVPGSVIGSGLFSLPTRDLPTDVIVSGISLEEFENTVTLGSSVGINPIPAPQSYFLQIQDSSGLDGFGIFWASSQTDNLAFELTGSGNLSTVPEPAGSCLAGSALLGFAMWRRSRTAR